jgi:hypothetical protein
MNWNGSFLQLSEEQQKLARIIFTPEKSRTPTDLENLKKLIKEGCSPIVDIILSDNDVVFMGTCPNLEKDERVPWSLLHVAIFRGYGDAVRVLLSSKVVRPVDQMVVRDLDWSVLYVMLREYPFQFNRRSLHPRIANFIKLFCEYGVPVDEVICPSGKMAIHLACISRGSLMFKLDGNDFGLSIEIVEVLLKAKADVNARDTNGLTALHYAAMSGNGMLVRLLIANGAIPSLKDNNDRTAEDVARYGAWDELNGIGKEMSDYETARSVLLISTSYSDELIQVILGETVGGVLKSTQNRAPQEVFIPMPEAPFVVNVPEENPDYVEPMDSN